MTFGELKLKLHTDSAEPIGEFTPEELAEKAKTGCARSFAELVERFHRPLFHFVKSRLGNREDAEDVVQEAFVRAYENIDRYDPTYRFSTWIYTIAGRLAVRQIRSRRRPDDYRPTNSDASADPSDGVILSEEKQSLWTLARQLPAAQYQALWLRYVEDMPIKDVAAVMEKTQIHVRVLLHRARETLSRQMNVEKPAETVTSRPPAS
jgi:RNA polymerase sigma-70 factor (ECF subfamily)